MDHDIDIARALDTIAEEISTKNMHSELPFELQFYNEGGKELSDQLITTLRAAMRAWVVKQDLENRIFRIARMVIKYGDCFFQKTSDFKKWRFIAPRDILGIEIDEMGVIVAYHVRKGVVDGRTASLNYQTDVIPAAGIIHFTLSDSMGPSAPFGESVLAPIVRTFRQLGMLEDSMLIYRIVRAPERRVFYVDVGNMPAQRVQQYLDKIKNDIRQKRTPNGADANNPVVDGSYNPQCLTLDTRIPLLDGRTLSLSQMIVEHEGGKQNWVYSCDPLTGEVVPGIVSWAGVTRKNAQLVKITLDSGEVITCTPDHKFPVFGKGFVEAQDLQSDYSLISFNTRDKSLSADADRSYQQVFDHATNEWRFTHRLVAEYFSGTEVCPAFTHNDVYAVLPKTTVHHVDYDRRNNEPTNLVWMHKKDHFQFHSDNKKKYWSEMSVEQRAVLSEKVSVGLKRYFATRPAEEKAAHSVRSAETFTKFWDEFRGTERHAEMNKKAQLTKAARRAAGVKYINHGNTKFNGTQPLSVSRMTLGVIVDILKSADLNLKEFMEAANANEKAIALLKQDNMLTGEFTVSKFGGTFTAKTMKCIYDTYGYRNWKHFKECALQYNHKVVSVEFLTESQDTGCITVDGDHVYHDHHTFALESGVFTRNSMQEDFFFPVTANGRGSRVETLPGGTGLGENADLLYFQEKIFRGLRVPMSYMMSKDGAGGGVYNDGKVGVAFIEEMRFANYVKRFQNKIEHVFTQQFKDFLKSSQIKVDSDIFTLRLPDPQNFALYRQAALDAELINTFNSADNIKYLSKQFILQRYLGLTDEEIKQNEELLMNERSIIEGAEVPTSQQMYDPAVYENREAVKVEAPEPEAPPEEAPPEEDIPPEEAPPEEPPADETPEVDLTAEEPPEEEAPKEKPAKEPKP